MLNVSKILLQGFALALNADEKSFEEFFSLHKTLSTLRLNYYPLREDLVPVTLGNDGEPLSCEVHVDGSVLTLLYQPDVGGLQVEDNDKWLDITPMKEAFVVNTGVCLQRWSNDKLKPAKHRVRLLKQERISIPFFLEPNYDALIETISSCVDDNNSSSSSSSSHYPPTTYAEYILESNKRFKEYQRKEMMKS